MIARKENPKELYFLFSNPVTTPCNKLEGEI